MDTRFPTNADMGRRSSVYGSYSSAPQAMKDPRNIRDKTFQHNCIRTLIEFLSENGYDRPISPKILTAPSGKDFQYIFQFLYSQLDPHYQFTGKFEEEVPIIIKGIR